MLKSFSAWMVFGLAVLLAWSCGSGEGDRLQRGVRYAKITLEKAGTSPMAALALQSAEETGGDAVSYILASLPDQNPVFTRYERGRPSRPWTVVIRPGEEPRQYVIEGYGQDLEKPLYEETVRLGPPLVE